jgi:predicted O-methyltransferase YrrM
MSDSDRVSEDFPILCKILSEVLFKVFQLSADGGILRLYEKFLKNVKKAGYDKVITPFRLPSLSAAHVLKCFDLRADFIFIDADHEYVAVKQDLYIFNQLLMNGGILFGDDWGWPGVQKAVTEFVKENQYFLYDRLEDQTWVIGRH